MHRKKTLRMISLVMLIAGIVFVCCALANPGLGRVLYIGELKIDADVKRVIYAIYAAGMVAIFTASFFVKDNGSEQKTER